jgi:HlyD family secretion protein
LPYLTANVRFVLHQETNALLVPNAALRWTPSSLAQIAPDARPNHGTDPAASDPPGVNQPEKKEKGQKSSRRTLWLKEGGFVRPIEIAAGVSDGANTVVAGEGLREGQEVVTGDTAASAQTDVKSPFLPKVLRR